MLAWTDESGNTGQNLFDKDQPYFWTGTLLCDVDLDMEASQKHKAWLAKLGVTELHGSALRVERIDKIAESLRVCLERFRTRFIFTKIDKLYHAKTTLALFLFDPEVNSAVDPFTQVPAMLRRLIYCTLRFLTPRAVKQFWSAYEKKDPEQFAQSISSILLRVQKCPPSFQEQDALLSALEWAFTHPNEILRWKRDRTDSPNVFALQLIVAAIHRHIDLEEVQITSFIHDTQSQFGNALTSIFENYKNIQVSPADPWEIPSLSSAIKFLCPMEMKDSSDSIGLQIIDIVLFLITAAPHSILGQDSPCKSLLNFIEKHSVSKNLIPEDLDRLIGEDRVRFHH
jgi:Protein of unknown function (DUF3800)